MIRAVRYLLLLFFASIAAGQTFDAGQLKLRLNASSQTVESIIERSSSFDFAPSDRLASRSNNGFYHLGDVRFAVRQAGTREWRWYSTAAARSPVRGLKVNSPDLAAADLSPTLPADCPLEIVRRWTIVSGRLVLRFEVSNRTNAPIEIGGFGIALSFNNILTDRSLAEAHERCSFSDPYVGSDAGYLQVTRLKGIGPALVVVPDGKTPFEGYQLLSEPMRPSQTFEGTFEWLAHTKALTETTWKDTEPWNDPTSEIILAGRSTQFGLKFLVSPDIAAIERTLADNGRPVAVGVPGYILPKDIESELFVKHRSPIRSVSAAPAGALTVARAGRGAAGWDRLRIRPNGWGRSRLNIEYADGARQTIHYYLTKGAAETVGDLGRFLFSKQWFDDPTDPFGRSPSVISYDRETDAPVLQDNRAWIAGLGDEAGSGSWLAAAMKEQIAPDEAEIAKFERFVDGVLWGGLQYSSGALKYGVRKSMFYYAPDLLPGFKYDPAMNWTTWASWKKDHAESIGRGYNYPHVVAAYRSLYRIARNTRGLVKRHSWEWYLEQAFQTTNFAFSRNSDGTRRVEYVELGMMEGSVFLELLRDLRSEGWNEKADDLERLMLERAERWEREEYPFGSEMAWDSTGQEEVYAWCRHFGFDEKAMVSLRSIMGYMPTVPHWGYNGNARRYWDFLYGGKLRRIERQLHHYGSGMNAIPVLSYYREHPDQFYLLRIGYGGFMGALSNIDRDGFASAAFHSYPDTMKWDAYSGDYGPNFFGHALNAATYVVRHPDFGWIAFGGNITASRRSVTVIPRDAARQRIYLAPFGLWLTLDSGRFSRIEFAIDGSSVRVFFDPANRNIDSARLRIERLTGNKVAPEPSRAFPKERGAYVIDLSERSVSIEFGGTK